MKKITGLLLALFCLAAPGYLWATDTTSVIRKEDQRVQRMINLLNRQVILNATLPVTERQYIIDGRKKAYDVPTFEDATYNQLLTELKKINGDVAGVKDQEKLAKIKANAVAFYIIIPPPLLLSEFRVDSSWSTKSESRVNKGKRVVGKEEYQKQQYLRSRKKIEDFTQLVFSGSMLNNTTRKGVLLNLDSYIEVVHIRNKKKEGEEDDKDVVKEVTGLGRTFVEPFEFFYPCVVFGHRIDPKVMREAIDKIRERTKKHPNFKALKGTGGFFSYKLIDELTQMYIETLGSYIKEKGRDFSKEAIAKANFKSNWKVTLLKGTPFTKKQAILNKLFVYPEKEPEAKNTDVFTEGNIKVYDYARLFDGEIISFIDSSDVLMRQFLSPQRIFSLEVITTSEASIEYYNKYKVFSRIKGKTAHQIAYERPIDPHAVRISVHMRTKKMPNGDYEIFTQWTMRLGAGLAISDDLRDIFNNPSGTFDFWGLLAQHSLYALKKGLTEAAKQLTRLKIKESVWNDTTLKEPVRTIMPMLAGIYNGIIDQVVEVPNDGLFIMKMAKAIVMYLRDDVYKQEVHRLLKELKPDTIKAIAKRMVEAQIAQYKNVKNPSYIVGHVLSSIILTAMRTISQGGLPLVKKLIKETIKPEIKKMRGKSNFNKWLKDNKKLVDKRRKKNKDGGGKKKKDDGKKDDKKKKDNTSQSERFVVEKTKLGKGLKLVVYKKEKSSGAGKKGKKSSGKETATILAESALKKVNNKNYLYNIKIKKGKGYNDNTILNKFFFKLKSQHAKGYYTSKKGSSAKTDSKGKVAINNGFDQLSEAKGGTIFSKKSYYVKQGIVYETNRKNKKLASGKYYSKLKTMGAALEDNVPEKEKNGVLDALWEHFKEKNKGASLNVVLTTDQMNLIKSDGSDQEALNRDGKQTDVGKWASSMGLMNTIPYYKSDGETIRKIHFTKTACFVAGTKIWLADYTIINIEDVRGGMMVRAFDPATKREVIGRVAYTMIKDAVTLIKVYTSTGSPVLVTPEHPFYVNGNWIKAEKLRKGDRFTLLDQKSLLASKTRHLARSEEMLVDSIAVQDTLVTVYNFNVARYHNYYVGNTGILVHNANCNPDIKTRRKNGNKQFEAYFEYVSEKLGQNKEKSLGLLNIVELENIDNLLSFELKLPKHLRNRPEFVKELLNKLYKKYIEQGHISATTINGIILPKNKKYLSSVQTWAKNGGYKLEQTIGRKKLLIREGKQLVIMVENNKAKFKSGTTELKEVLGTATIDKQNVLSIKIENDKKLQELLDKHQKNAEKKTYKDLKELKETIVYSLFVSTSKEASGIYWHSKDDKAMVELIKKAKPKSSSVEVEKIDDYKYKHKTANNKIKLSPKEYEFTEKKEGQNIKIKIAQGVPKSSSEVKKAVSEVVYDASKNQLTFDLQFEEQKGFNSFGKYFFKEKHTSAKVTHFIIKKKDAKHLQNSQGGFASWLTQQKFTHRYNLKEGIMLRNEAYWIKEDKSNQQSTKTTYEIIEGLSLTDDKSSKVSKVIYHKKEKRLSYEPDFEKKNGFEAFAKHFKHWGKVEHLWLAKKYASHLQNNKGFAQWATLKKFAHRYNLSKGIMLRNKSVWIKEPDQQKKDIMLDIIQGLKLDSQDDSKITKVTYKQNTKAFEFDLEFDDYAGFEVFDEYFFKGKYKGKQVEQYILKPTDKKFLKTGMGFVKWAAKNKIEFRFNFKDKVQILKKPFIVKVISEGKSWDAYLGYRLSEHKEDATQKAYHITYNSLNQPYYLKFELKANELKKYKSSALKAAAFNVYEYIAGRGSKKKLSDVAGIFIALNNTISDVHKKIGNTSIITNGYDQKLIDIIKAGDITNTLVFPSQYKVFYYLDGIGIGTPFEVKPGKESNIGQDKVTIVADCKGKEAGKISIEKGKGYFTFYKLFENKTRLFYHYKTVLDVLYNKAQGKAAKLNMFAIPERVNGKTNPYLFQLKAWGTRNGFTKKVEQGSGGATKYFRKDQTPEIIVNNAQTDKMTISMNYGEQLIKDKRNSTVLFAKVNIKTVGLEEKNILQIDFKDLSKLLKDNKVNYQPYKQDINKFKADILTAILKKIKSTRFAAIQIDKDYQYLKLWQKDNSSSTFKYIHQFAKNKSANNAIWLSDKKYLLEKDKISETNPIWDVSQGQEIKGTQNSSTQIAKVGYDVTKKILIFKDIKGLDNAAFDAIVAHIKQPNKNTTQGIVGVAITKEDIQKATKARKVFKSWLRNKRLTYQYGVVVQNTVPENLTTYPQYYLKKLADYFKVLKKLFANVSQKKTETYLFMKQPSLVFGNNSESFESKEWTVILGYKMTSEWTFKASPTAFRFKLYSQGKGIHFIDEDESTRNKQDYNLASFTYNSDLTNALKSVFSDPAVKNYCTDLSGASFDNKAISDDIKKLEKDRSKNEQQILNKAKKINHIAHWILSDNALLKGKKFITATNSYDDPTIVITTEPCFPAGTLIKTAKGYKQIEHITKQDSVYACHTATGEVALQPVLNTTQKAARQLINIYGQGKLLVQSTPNHRFYQGATEASAGRWIAAEYLQSGDSLWLFHQRKIAIDSLVKVDTLVRVYNFEVANYHTYYVGKQGILVHNDCSQKLPDLFVQVQSEGMYAVKEIIREAELTSRKLQQAIKSKPKLKVHKSNIKLRVGSSAKATYNPSSVWYQGSVGDLNKSKAPQIMGRIYLGDNNKYVEDFENIVPTESAYNRRYLLAIFRDMIYEQQKPNKTKKDMHCWMFPIIPDPANQGQINDKTKRLLRPLLAKLKTGNNNVLHDQINYLPVMATNAQLMKPPAFGKYNKFLEEALESITEKYKTQIYKNEIKASTVREELLHVIRQARRYFGNQAVPRFAKKDNYVKEIAPTTTILTNWSAKYEPLNPGLEGITYRMIELGIDLFFRGNPKAVVQGKVMSKKVNNETLLQAGIGEALRNKEFSRIAKQLYQKVSSNKGTKYFVNKLKKDSPGKKDSPLSLLKTLLRTYLIKSLFREDRREANSFSEMLRKMTIQSQNKFGDSPIKGTNLLFINGLNNLKISDRGSIEQICVDLQVLALASTAILRSIKNQNRVAASFKNCDFEAVKQELMAKDWKRVILQVNDGYVVQAGWDVYGITHEGGDKINKKLIGSPGKAIDPANHKFLSDNDPKTALYCVRTDVNSNDPDKVLEELVLIEGLTFGEMTKTEQDFAVNVAGQRKSVISNKPGAWWNTQITIRLGNSIPRHVAFWSAGALMVFHYSARYKADPTKPLPWWAYYVKEGTEWFWLHRDKFGLY